MTAHPRYGSDLIADLLVEAGVEYVAFNPGATFRAIHDSLVNHTTDGPAVVLCGTEGISVAVAQGYAKASGKPMASMVHNIVGLQNASMAIYNAWCDRVPMMLIGGTGPRSKVRRRPWIDWIHTAVDQGALIRDFVKWDDEPRDIGSMTESFARALTTTRSAPEGPVYLCYDVDLQEESLPQGFEPPGLHGFAVPSAPAPDSAAIDWLCERLEAAERPVIIAGHTGDTDESFAALVQLAEGLGAPVVDAGWRLAFPSSHPLNATRSPEILEQADMVLALDVDDIQGRMEGLAAPLVNVTVAHLRLRGWSHDYHALPRTERHITSSGDAAVRALLGASRSRQVVPRDVSSVTGRIRTQRANQQRAAARAEADGAIPTERLLYELGRALSSERYVLTNGTNARLEHELWDLDRSRQYLGATGGGGLGYGLGATIGASLALERDAIAVDVQADGDLLYTPTALWTMAHLSRPALVTVFNNRQYGNSVEHAVKIARARGRRTENRYVGTGLAEPPIDFAGMATAFGLWAAGPLTDVEALDEALQEAVAVVRSGRPALLDVVVPGF